METFSALLALCEGNPPATIEFTKQRPIRRDFDVFIMCVWLNGWANSRYILWFETPCRSLWRHCDGQIYNLSNIFSRVHCTRRIVAIYPNFLLLLFVDVAYWGMSTVVSLKPLRIGTTSTAEKWINMVTYSLKCCTKNPLWIIISDFFYTWYSSYTKIMVTPLNCRIKFFSEGPCGRICRYKLRRLYFFACVGLSPWACWPRPMEWWAQVYRKMSNISCTKSENLNVFRLGLHSSLLNILKPSVQWGMKMWLEQSQRAMLRLHLSGATIRVPTIVRFVLETWRYVRYLDQYQFRWWLVTHSAPRHCLNECWVFGKTHLPRDKMAAILADDIFKCIFLNENDRIPIDNKPALVQVMAWHRAGYEPSPRPKMTQFIDAYMRH